jgi:hypothetical protein
VRERQTWGWTIALHGYRHNYVNQNAGIMKLNRQSEFAGLSAEEQRQKLAAGVAIFKSQGVKPEAWVAPSHSFDWNTVRLLPEFGINIISDGLWRWPHTDARNMTWVPQQLWDRPRKAGPGVWTVCHHHNGWTPAMFDIFQSDAASYGASMTGLAEVVREYAGRHLTVADRFHAHADFLVNRRLRPLAARVLRRKPGAKKDA